MRSSPAGEAGADRNGCAFSPNSRGGVIDVNNFVLDSEEAASSCGFDRNWQSSRSLWAILNHSGFGFAYDRRVVYGLDMSAWWSHLAGSEDDTIARARTVARSAEACARRVFNALVVGRPIVAILVFQIVLADCISDMYRHMGLFGGIGDVNSLDMTVRRDHEVVLLLHVSSRVRPRSADGLGHDLKLSTSDILADGDSSCIVHPIRDHGSACIHGICTFC